MSAVQHANLDVQRADSLGVTAVDTRVAVNDALTHGAVFDLAEHVFDFTGSELAFFFARQRSNSLVAQLAQTSVTLLLVDDGVGVSDASTKLALDGVDQRGVLSRSLPVPSRLTSFSSEFLDGSDGALEFHVSEQYRAQHLVFGQFLCFGLNHQYRFFGTGNDHVQTGGGQLFVGRVQHVTALIVEGNTGCTNRAAKRHAGDGQGSGGTDHGSDVRIGGLVGGHYGADNLHFVHEAFGEQRADRTVDQARGQGLFLGGTAFTLEETTGDTASGVGLLDVVHRQREEITTSFGLLGGHDGDQNADSVVDADQNGTGSLASNAACFHGNGAVA